MTDAEDNRVVLAELLDDETKLLVRATDQINQVFTSLRFDAAELNEVICLLNRIRSEAGDIVEDP